MKDTKRVKKERNLSEADEADVIAANVFLDSEKSPKTELSVTRRDSEKPLASLKMMGAGNNDFQGVLAISTVNSGTPGGPLVERMRIHTNGYMGIGTDNPKTPLHIPEQGLQIGTSAQASDNFHIVSDFTGNARGLRLLNGNYGAGTPLLTVLANGNAGIGTTGPAQKLEISGANAGLAIGGRWNDPIVYTSYFGKPANDGSWGNGSAYLKIIDDVTSADQSIKGTRIEVYTHKYGGATNFAAVFGANGNIGIGTTSPQAKLDVAGNIKCGTSQTVNKESAIIFSGLNGDVDKIYELRLFGRMDTAVANKNIRLGPNKNFATSGFRNLAHRFYPGGHDIDTRNNGGLTLGFTDWNADGDIFIMARFYAATGKSRALEATHLYTNSAAGSNIELCGSHIGWWSDTTTNITSLVIDFNGGAFTGTALLTTVQP